MPAARYDFTDDNAWEQGANLSRLLTYKDPDGVPIDLTGYSARMQVRESVSDDEVLFELTSPAGIVLGGAAGTLTLTADAATTALWDWQRGVYDIELVSPTGFVSRLVEGSITVKPEVTR